MYYKAEVLENGRAIKQYLKNGVSHPNQVIHSLNGLILNSNRPIFMAIMNEHGDRWLYIIEPSSKGYKPRVMKKDRGHFNKDEVKLILCNQRPIYRGEEL